MSISFAKHARTARHLVCPITNIGLWITANLSAENSRAKDSLRGQDFKKRPAKNKPRKDRPHDTAAYNAPAPRKRKFEDSPFAALAALKKQDPKTPDKK